MSAPSRRRGPDGASGETAAIFGAIGLGIVVVAAAFLGSRIGYEWAGLPASEQSNPIALVVEVATGQAPWPTESWVVAGGVVGIAAVVAILMAIVFRGSGTVRFDRAAQFMGRGKAIGDLTRKGVAAKASRLGIDPAKPGVRLGTAVGGTELFMSWEDVSVAIAGPRVGKTTSLVIPAIADAPGAVVTTSNKRDVVDATRALRTMVGGRVWVFDPQEVADEPASWFWNPLTFVTNEVKAVELATLFSDASRPAGSRKDAFFDGSAETLLAGMLLAAARAGRPLSVIHQWLSDVSDDEAVFILQNSGDSKSAESIKQIVDAPEKQKGGIYGTAQNIMSFLINDQAMRWVEPTPPTGEELERGRDEFRPVDFVRSNGTLYSLSKEGVGSAGPLVTALTVAVTQAAEEYAKTQRGGRLAVPMLLVLDEAANVCRWNNLPDLYSHYGSRGICIITILQSWSQGVEVWNEFGMKKLWTAANAKLYMGGVDEDQFLGSLSQLVGEYDATSRSVSTSSSGRSSSMQTRKERILDPADLRAMPRGRAILLYSGTPPVLLKTVPWMQGPHAKTIEAAAQEAVPA